MGPGGAWAGAGSGRGLAGAGCGQGVRGRSKRPVSPSPESLEIPSSGNPSGNSNLGPQPKLSPFSFG